MKSKNESGGSFGWVLLGLAAIAGGFAWYFSKKSPITTVSNEAPLGPEQSEPTGFGDMGGASSGGGGGSSAGSGLTPTESNGMPKAATEDLSPTKPADKPKTETKPKERGTGLDAVSGELSPAKPAVNPVKKEVERNTLVNSIKKAANLMTGKTPTVPQSKSSAVTNVIQDLAPSKPKTYTPIGGSTLDKAMLSKKSTVKTSVVVTPKPATKTVIPAKPVIKVAPKPVAKPAARVISMKPAAAAKKLSFTGINGGGPSFVDDLQIQYNNL